MKKNLTPHMEDVRKLARSLWNRHFLKEMARKQVDPDTLLDGFEDVELGLLTGLVLSQLDCSKTSPVRMPEKEEILFNAKRQRGVEFLLRKPSEQNYYWDSVTFGPEWKGAIFSFSEFSDWDLYRKRKYEFVWGKVIRCPKALQMIGREVSFKFEDVGFFADSNFKDSHPELS